MPEREFILCTLGSRGDFAPFLGLASTLLRRGHKVTLLSNANWREEALQAGAAFERISDEDPPQSGRDDFAFFLSNTLPSFERSFSFIARKVRENAHCTLVYRYNMLGAECAAEKFKLANVKIALQPSAIRSAERPPWPMTPLTQGPLGIIGKKAIVPLIYGISEMTRRYRKHANAFRKSVGAKPVAFGRAGSSPENLLLMMCPEWFAMPQTDWPANCRMVGFPFLDVAPRDVEIDKFIDRWGAPIVFTPGTGVTDVGRFFANASDICRLLDMPGIFLSRYGRRRSAEVRPGILVRDYVDLSSVLLRARMLIHHGGIGTTAQAIRHGVPQVVFAGRFDQPDNALRVAIFGLGAAVYSKAVDIRILVDQIRIMLANEEVREQLAIAARLVASENALQMAASLIEDCAASAAVMENLQRAR
jgi:UDP:flavonoid glycosyltransferase YjiC (YdhE family)